MSFVQEMQLLDFTGPTRAIDLLALETVWKGYLEESDSEGDRASGGGNFRAYGDSEKSANRGDVINVNRPKCVTFNYL